MKRTFPMSLLLVTLLCWSCQKETLRVYRPTDLRLRWSGRTFADESGNTYLIGSASSLKFAFHGTQCKVWLRNAASGQDYNYISIVVDGVHQPRQAIHFTSQTAIDITPEQTSDSHTIELYKETEAFNGAIIISKIEVDSLGTLPQDHRKKIEFIGNSITVGMSSDASRVPCESGMWYDQHNVYDAYGPRVARALDMDYMVTGFSGIGVYRNTRADRPVMADLFPSTVLSPDPKTPRWDFKKFVPDIVSICLGTNDFSAGDGASPRSPFDPDQFVPAYVSLLKMIYTSYPQTQVILTNTPMLNSNQNEILMQCLTRIKSDAERTIPGIKPPLIFSFSKSYMSGCQGHPSVEEHGKMAEEMVGYLRGMK